MFILLAKMLLRKRNAKQATDAAAETPRPTPTRKPRPEWEKVLLASLELNNLAPPEEVILVAFDLFKDDLYGPVMERRLVLTELFAEIIADIASLKAVAPGLVERAMARHPFEFSQVIEHKEQN